MYAEDEMHILKIAEFAAGGGLAGYLWHRLVGCSSGGCPIVRSPWLSTIWGALIGLAAVFSR